MSNPKTINQKLFRKIKYECLRSEHLFYASRLDKDLRIHSSLDLLYLKHMGARGLSLVKVGLSN